MIKIRFRILTSAKARIIYFHILTIIIRGQIAPRAIASGHLLQQLVVQFDLLFFVFHVSSLRIMFKLQSANFKYIQLLLYNSNIRPHSTD